MSDTILVMCESGSSPKSIHLDMDSAIEAACKWVTLVGREPIKQSVEIREMSFGEERNRGILATFYLTGPEIEIWWNPDGDELTGHVETRKTPEIWWR